MSIRKDLHNNIDARLAFNTATIATDTTTAGNIIDTKGYGAVEFIISGGTRTDGTYTPLIEEGDASNMVGATAVADENLFGTEALAAITVTNSIKRIGYRVGKWRYVRLSLVSTATTSGMTGMSAVAILANPDLAPVA